MSVWLIIQLLVAGLWLGCVLVEVAFERALVAQGQWRLLARLHDRVDRWLELPTLTVVALTGGWMLYSGFGSGGLSLWLQAKLAFGTLAVLANLYCAVLVFRRHRMAEIDDLAAVKRIDHLQHKVGALVLLGLIGAITCGMAALALS